MRELPERVESGQVAGLLAAWRAGDHRAMDRLVPRVYDTVHALAARHLRRERDGRTLAPTALAALVHDAWQRLVGERRAARPDRVHFVALASRVLRRALVDHARRALTAAHVAHAAHAGQAAHGAHGPALYVEPEAGARAADEWALTVMALDDALAQLGLVDPRLPRVVECRFFGGLTEAETAEVLGVSGRTVHRDWQRARAWLALRLQD